VKQVVDGDHLRTMVCICGTLGYHRIQDRLHWNISNHFSDGSVAVRELLIHLRSQLESLC